jgi:hypothetical protein
MLRRIRRLDAIIGQGGRGSLRWVNCGFVAWKIPGID